MGHQTPLIPVGAPQFIIIGISIALLAYYTQVIKDFQGYSKKIDREQFKLHKDLTKIPSFPIKTAAVLRFVSFINFLMLVVAVGRLYFLHMLVNANEEITSIVDHILLGSLFLQVLVLITFSVPYILRKEYDALTDDEDDKKEDGQNKTEPPEPTELQSNV